MHASKGRKYYACTEKRSQKRREIMVTITRRDLCRLALLSLMVAFDGRSYKSPHALNPMGASFSPQLNMGSNYLQSFKTDTTMMRRRHGQNA